MVKMKDNIIKSFAAAFALVMLITACVVMTTSIKPKAGNNTEFDFSTMSKAATTYFNWSKSNGGTYMGTASPDPGIAAGLVGFQSKSDDAITSFVYGNGDAVNGIVYSFEGLSSARVTDNDEASKPYVDAARAKAEGKMPPAVSSTSAGSPTTAFVNYAGYGYMLSELGFDKVGTKGGGLRMVSGTLMLAVYILSTALTTFMDVVVEVLRFANPFSIFENIAEGDVSTEAGSVQTAFHKIAEVVTEYYQALREISLWLIVPFTLVIALFRWIMSDNAKTFWPHMKNFFIRFLFAAIGIPMFFSIYDTVLSWINADVEMDTSTTVVTSTFLDFEKWANKYQLDADIGYSLQICQDSDSVTVQADGTIVRMGDYYAPSNNAIIRTRDTCYSINHGSKGVSGNSKRGIGGSSSATQFSEYEFGFVSSKQTDPLSKEYVIDLLKRYSQGSVITAGGYGATVTQYFGNDAVMDTSRVYQCFDPYQIASALQANTNSKGVSKTDAHDIAAKRYSSSTIWSSYDVEKNPWLIEGKNTGDALKLSTNTYGGRLSWMGTYNYLNSEFTKNGVIVYAPDTTGDQNIKTSHYSVNLVGKGLMAILYYLDALVLMGCITLIGYLYGGALLLGNFKAIFQLIPNVFSGLLGSIKGIGMTIALLFAVIANVILTFLMFSIASDIYEIAHYLVQLPVSIALTKANTTLGLGGTVLYMLSMLISMLLLCTVTSKLLTYRKAVCQAATQGLTDMVGNTLGVRLSAPNLQSNGSGLQTLGAAAAGLGLAAANGAFDNLDSERLGLGSEGFTQDNVGNTLGGDSEGNQFGVVGGENGLNGEGMEHVGDEDSGLNVDKSGELVNDDGTPLTDSEGNAIGMDEDGNLVSADGSPLVDENGDPIKADSAHLDENGNLVDADGNAITDASGGSINDNDVMTTDSEGNITDANGDPITDEEGRPLSVDENGNVVDSQGNPVTDSHGNPLKQDPKTGKIVDGQGNAVKADNKGDFRDNGGAGGAVKKSDGSSINGNPTAQAHTNGNITDSEGTVLTDENGDPLRIDDDPYARDENGNVITDAAGNPVENPNYGKVVDGQGNVVTDSNGNALTVGSGGVVRDGDGNAIRADENGTMVDGNGEAITAAQTDNEPFMRDENGEIMTNPDGSYVQNPDYGEVKMEDGKPVSAGNGVITNAPGYSGANTGNMTSDKTAAYQQRASERAMNADQQAEQYLAGQAAVAGTTGADMFSNGSTVKGNNGRAVSKGNTYATTGKAGNGNAVLGNANANVAGGHTEAGLMLDNGSQINDIAMPEGSTAGVVTEKGFMSAADAQAKGLDGVSAIQTSDGNIIYGVQTDGNDFVPGIQTNDGFIPGVTSNGKFVPGGFDDSGNFHAGVYTNNGFAEGTFKNGSFVSGRTMADGTVEAGQYTTGGFQRADGSVDASAIAPNMGNAVVGSSVVSTANGANIVDSNGGAAAIYANNSGNLAVGSVDGGKIAVQQNASTGNMAYQTADGKALDIKSGSFDQMQVGSVDASAVNGGIVMNDGNGGAVSVVPNDIGAASIPAGNGGNIGLTTTSKGNTALSTGDGNAIGMYTADDGSMRLQTRSGQGIQCVALDNGGVGVVDSNGNVAPVVTTDNGHLALQSGNDFVPITADRNGNAMIGNNRPNGAGVGASSAYIIPVAGGGFGINNQGVHYQAESGSYKPLASSGSNGVVEIVSAGGSGGQLQFKNGAGSHDIDISSSGAGSVRIAGNDGRSAVITNVDDSMVVDGGASGSSGRVVAHGTYHKATNSDVAPHAAASNSTYDGGYSDAPAVERMVTSRGTYVRSERGWESEGSSRYPNGGSGGNSGGVAYNVSYAANADITRNSDFGGFTVDSFQGRRSAGTNVRQVRISGNSATNNDFNVVQMIKDNPMMAAMIVNGIANKNVGSVAMGVAMGYSNSTANGGATAMNNHGGYGGNEGAPRYSDASGYGYRSEGASGSIEGSQRRRGSGRMNSRPAVYGQNTRHGSSSGNDERLRYFNAKPSSDERVNTNDQGNTNNNRT